MNAPQPSSALVDCQIQVYDSLLYYTTIAIHNGLIAIKTVTHCGKVLAPFSPPYWVEGVKKVYASCKIWVLFCYVCLIKTTGWLIWIVFF